MSLELKDSTLEKVTRVLEDLLNNISLEGTAEHKQKDLFLLLIIALLSENNFLLVIEDTIDVHNLYLVDDVQLSKWEKSGGISELKFVMTGFSEIFIKLILCSLGSTCLINICVCDISSEVYSVCLSVNQYVSPEASTIPLMFPNLQDLSDTLKNKIITPVRSAVLTYCGYSSASLIGVPEEILFNMLLYLPVVDIISVSKTCKKLNSLLDNDILWHKLCLRDFKNVTVNDIQDWKSVYKTEYKLYQDSKIIFRQRDLFDDMHSYVSGFVPYIGSPLMDYTI